MSTKADSGDHAARGPAADAPFTVHSLEFDYPGNGAIQLQRHRFSVPLPPPAGGPSFGPLDDVAVPTEPARGTPVPSPEFVAGARSEPAAFVMGTRPGVRAVLCRLPGYESGSYEIGAAGSHGDVRIRRVQPVFGTSGLSDPIEFELSNPLPQRVDRLPLSLDWFARRAGSSSVPKAIGSTTHGIYLTVAHPVAPWQETMPWVDALDLACTWAAGSTTTEEVPEAITRAVNGLPNLRYHAAATFGGAIYLLSSFLWLLETGTGFHVNCTDCANTVVTLANLLGCDLVEGRVFDLTTRRFLKLAGDPASDEDWVSYEWNYHELAWLHGMGPRRVVYDGCLQLDTDENDADAVHVPELPATIPFERYRDLLVANGPCALARSPSRRAVA